MSLKVFHIVFITASVLLALGAAVYCVAMLDGTSRVIWTTLSVATAIGLAVYGRAFLNKMQHLYSN